ncbi:lambda-exonuclease family protein [Pseudomonas sp. FSL W7-0098]|uniref:lambda-exonuclease family protein n=1 Tax=Pseudomonas sp. FSL W7-0098 TaxID=2496120 RepID=UPI001EE83AA1|nr:YqaJ viral recombinase family protein [Pseudomonas sp. FSL W7-0098]
MKATSLNRSTDKPRPALRLISTMELPREDWLAVRKQGIGSSDAGAAVGLNPYKSQLELWLEKTGRDTTLPKADPHDEESPMYWGSVLTTPATLTIATLTAAAGVGHTLVTSNPDYEIIKDYVNKQLKVVYKQ